MDSRNLVLAKPPRLRFISAMAYEQQDRWRLTDVEVPFKCVLWWMMKVGSAALIVGGLMAFIVQGVLLIPSMIVPKKEAAPRETLESRMLRTQERQQRMAGWTPPPTSFFANSMPQPAPANTYVTNIPQQTYIRPIHDQVDEGTTQAASAAPPAQLSAPKGQEFSIFLDKPQQVTTPWGTHRIWIHDHGSETIPFAIDGQRAVQINKAHGSDLAGDNRVKIYQDSQMQLFHVNSPRAPHNCCLVIAFSSSGS